MKCLKLICRQKDVKLKGAKEWQKLYFEQIHIKIFKPKDRSLNFENKK